MTRSTTQRDKDRDRIKRGQPACGICGQPIDYTLPYLDPLSFEADHVIPLDAGGADTVDNKQASHRVCNRTKWHRTEAVTTPRTFVTWRSW